MNNDIIPQGLRELITGTAVPVAGNILVARALEDCTVSNVVYIYPVNTTPVSFTLKAGASLQYVKSFTVTGTVELVLLP